MIIKIIRREEENNTKLIKYYDCKTFEYFEPQDEGKSTCYILDSNLETCRQVPGKNNDIIYIMENGKTVDSISF